MNDKTNSIEKDTPPAPLKKIGNLRMVFDRAVHYPKQIAFALLALFVSAMATLAIPAGFKTIIDKGFMAGSGDVAPYFQGLLAIVAVLAVATAFRFYFVSWLGEHIEHKAGNAEITFAQLYELTGKDLTVVASDTTTSTAAGRSTSEPIR